MYRHKKLPFAIVFLRLAPDLLRFAPVCVPHIHHSFHFTLPNFWGPAFPPLTLFNERFCGKNRPGQENVVQKNRTYRSRLHEPPTHARCTTNRSSTTHRTIPQARSFERGSANRMYLIGTSARLCAQALYAGPSLHDGAGDKPGAHTTAQTIQETSQEKEEKRKTPALRRALCRLADTGRYSHSVRMQALIQRAHNAHHSAGQTTMPAAAPDRASRTHRLIQQCPQLTSSRSSINSIFSILSNADEREGEKVEQRNP